MSKGEFGKRPAVDAFLRWATVHRVTTSSDAMHRPLFCGPSLPCLATAGCFFWGEIIRFLSTETVVSNGNAREAANWDDT